LTALSWGAARKRHDYETEFAYMHSPALCRLLIRALCLVRAEQFTCCVFCVFRFFISNVDGQQGKGGHYKGFFIYAHYRSAQTSFIDA